MRPALLLFALAMACSSEEASSAPDAAPACESLDAYCSRNVCVRAGVHGTSEFSTWCRRVGPFSTYNGGMSTCGPYVIFEGYSDGAFREDWFDSKSGELLWVQERRDGASSCAGVVPHRNCGQSGVGMGCVPVDASAG